MRLPLPLENGYTSTRVPASLQRKLNMFRHSDRGWRQFPGFSQFADKTQNTPTYNNSKSYTGNTLRRDLKLHASGTKAFWLLPNTDEISEATMSVARDISTLGASTETSLTYTGSPDPNGLCFRSNGAQAYILDKTAKAVYEHTLTAWDTTTISYASKSLDVSSEFPGGSDYPMSIAPAHDGTKFYVLGSVSQALRVFQYSCSTAWDISTATYDAEFFDTGVTSALSQSGGISIEKNTAKMHLILPGETTVREYHIYNDISSASLMTTYDASAQDTSFNGGIAIDSGTGGSFYLLDEDNFYGYTMGGSAAYTVGGNSEVARGFEVMNGVLYVVYENIFYSVSSTGELTLIGSILGRDLVVMETDGNQLVITTGETGNTIYVFTAPSTLTIVSDGDVTDSAKSSAYIDQKWYLDQPNGEFIGSANDDATSFSTDDKAEAESFADDVVRMYAHNQSLYPLGTDSIEDWYTSGDGRPPIDRQNVIERGLAGTFAIDSIDNRIYFIDHERRLNAMSGSEYQPIYEPAVAKAWDSYGTVSDAIVAAYTFEQQNFVDCIFPSQNKVWTYHVMSGEWAEREHATGSRYRAIQYKNIYGKTLALYNSNIWALSTEAYTNSGDSITKTIDSGLITSEIFGDPRLEGRDMELNDLYITVETTGAASLTVSFSKDLSTFSQSRTISLTTGRQTRSLSQWGEFREGVIRLSSSSDVGISVVDLSADLAVLSG